MAGCVTQNVDGLHQLAGLPTEALAELHGNVRRAVCCSCSASWDIEKLLIRVDAGDDDPHCTECGGVVKSSTVMFGELLPEDQLEQAWSMASAADAVLVIGSTLSVYPAADVALSVAASGRPMVIVNQGPTENDHMAAVRIEARAGEVIPMLVERIIGS
jgi:NAD-dependent deacetylase